MALGAAVHLVGVVGRRSESLRARFGLPSGLEPRFAQNPATDQRDGSCYRFTDVFIAGQSSGSIGAAQTLIGKDRVFRVSPTVTTGRFSLDTTREIESLRGLGFSEARHEITRLRDVFFAEKAEPFVRPA